MPRQARLDFPGTLHHVICRGIEKQDIVSDDYDRNNFIERMRSIAHKTRTPIYAWALMTNHAHILLRSGPQGLSDFMRKLLTGYAVSYNRRHKRHGYLFQNRYKSIICEEENYLLELVRSQGGWSRVISSRSRRVAEKADERILGSGEFVEKIVAEAEEHQDRLLTGTLALRKVKETLRFMCEEEGVRESELRGGSRRRQISRLRKRIAFELIERCGIPMATVARETGVTTTAVSKMMTK